MFGDGLHILYVNGEYQDVETPVGRLMHDFYCTKSEDMYSKVLADEVKYLKEGLEVLLFFYESELLGIELPEKVDYTITQTEPAVKGNTVTGATKDAIIETGLLVKVPLFIENGEEIIVSTKDGKYVSRK